MPSRLVPAACGIPVTAITAVVTSLRRRRAPSGRGHGNAVTGPLNFIDEQPVRHRHRLCDRRFPRCVVHRGRDIPGRVEPALHLGPHAAHVIPRPATQPAPGQMISPGPGVQTPAIRTSPHYATTTSGMGRGRTCWQARLSTGGCRRARNLPTSAGPRQHKRHPSRMPLPKPIPDRGKWDTPAGFRNTCPPVPRIPRPGLEGRCEQPFRVACGCACCGHPINLIGVVRSLKTLAQRSGSRPERSPPAAGGRLRRARAGRL